MEVNPSILVGRYLESADTPNLKNLSPRERKNVVNIMENYEKIVLGKMKSPITTDQAGEIISKMKSNQNLNKSSKPKSIAKKVTSAFRITIGDLEKQHESWKSEMKARRQDNMEFLQKVGGVGTLIAEKYLESINEANEIFKKHPRDHSYDWSQRKCLDKISTEGPRLNPVDVKESREEWINVLKQLGGLSLVKSKGEAFGRVRLIVSAILANLSATGSLDEKFENEWKDGKFGNLNHFASETFKDCMAASYAIRGEFGKVKAYLDESKDEDLTLHPTKDIKEVFDKEGSEHSIKELKKIMDNVSQFAAH